MSYLLQLWRRSARLFLALVKIMFPVMLLVQLCQWLGWIDVIGRAIGPAMGWLGLPAEAGMVWIACAFVGIYGGVAVLMTLAPVLDLTVAQFSVLAAMMLFAHGLPVEQAIVRRAGASFWATLALRVGAAVVYAAVVSWACHWGGWLQQPLSLDWLPQASAGQGLEPSLAGQAGAFRVMWLQAWQWLLSTAWSLGLTYVVLLALLVLLDVLERTGITRLITALMAPVLRLSGLDPRVTPVTTVGVLLGLTYGGALIIEEAERQQYPARTRFLALAWLSLSHSLIEDTVLLMALGANGWVVLAGRVLLTLLVVAALARLIPGGKAGAARPDVAREAA